MGEPSQSALYSQNVRYSYNAVRLKTVSEHVEGRFFACTGARGRPRRAHARS